MEDRAGLQRMAGVCWRLGFLLEDSVHGGQDFAGGCSELYISVCKNDGVVCACAVCGLKGNIILISVDIVILYAAKRHMFLLFTDGIL